MSLGEPEIEPSRDIVVQALAAAARAGVVSVVAAGNDFSDFGRGSIGSPGSAPDAITVGAVSTSRSGPEDVVGSFSSSGPYPALAAAQAGSERAGRLDLLGRARRLLRHPVRDEHGGTACCRRRGLASPAPPDVDAGAGEIGAGADRRPCVDRRSEALGAPDHTRGRRSDQPAAGRQPAPLCLSRRALIRFPRADSDPDTTGRPHGRRWRRRPLDRFAEHAVRACLGRRSRSRPP